MPYTMICLCFLWLASTTVASAASAATDKDKANVAEAYEKTAQMNKASFVTEIVFNRGSSELSADGKSQLRDVLDAAQSRGEVDEVKILSWADTEYPVKGKKADKNAAKLADERGQEIEGFIVDRMKGVNVEGHNMAELPGPLSKIFRTGDVRVKRSLEQAGLLLPAKSGMPAKASRSLVMVIIK